MSTCRGFSLVVLGCRDDAEIVMQRLVVQRFRGAAVGAEVLGPNLQSRCRGGAE
jgi:hypothetical protein